MSQSPDYVLVRRWMTADQQRRDEFGVSRLLDALEGLEGELARTREHQDALVSPARQVAHRVLEDYGRRNRGIA
jgi:hypothetical protein